jgi:RNA ligase (TIGR02306 family)
MSRALATIATIGEIHPHPDADRLEIATVRGWRAVVAKGAFHPTQTVLYIEPDAFLLDHEPRFAFLVDRSKRTAPDGKQGHVLRTVRLRGVVSQGLVMDLADWPELHGCEVGDDVTSLIPIRLWEPPVPLGSKLAGKFPGHLPKTDEERIQNIEQHRLDALAHAELIVVTEKVDGTSITVWMKGDGTLGIAGRNWELAADCNTYRAVADTQAARWIAESDGTWAVQGELVGPGIQGNPLKLQGQRLMLFNVLRHGRNLSRHDWPFDLTLESVPIRRTFVKGYVFGVPITDRDWWLEYADGLTSTVEGTGEQVLSEGVVIRAYDRDVQTDSFKAISATYLLKGERQ